MYAELGQRAYDTGREGRRTERADGRGRGGRARAPERSALAKSMSLIENTPWK